MITRYPVSFSFLFLCTVITIPGMISPGFYLLFNSELPHHYWWQVIIGPFQHGAIHRPGAILMHFGFNSTLLLTCGLMVERILGSGKMLILTLTAWIVFILTQSISGIWINGSSGIIWSYSPFLLIYLKPTKTALPSLDLSLRARMLLILMWLVVTLFMTIVPLFFNPSHTLIHTFIYGNLFHASGTLTGFVFYYFWRDGLRKGHGKSP